jgi:hypothetical protein
MMRSHPRHARPGKRMLHLMVSPAMKNKARRIRSAFGDCEKSHARDDEATG